MVIDYLANHQEAIPTLAEWYYEEWRSFSSARSLEEQAGMISLRCNVDSLPLALVALRGDEVLGTVSLKHHELSVRMSLSPWLSSLYVAPEYRRCGIGTELVAEAVARAQGMGLKRLYLFTNRAQSFYERLGWSRVESLNYRLEPIVIMRRNLVGDRAARLKRLWRQLRVS